MKVLHVIPSLAAHEGGPSVALPLIACSLALAGVDVTVATTSEKVIGAAGDGRPRIRVDNDATYLFFQRSAACYKVAFSMGAWLKHHISDYNLIHIHALFSYSSIAAARAARRAGIPYVIRPLGVLNRWGMENRRSRLKRLSLHWVELPLLRTAAAIHFTSRIEQEEAGASCPELAFLPSAVIPLPVSMPPDATLNRENFLKRFPRARNKDVILFLSRIDRKKGLELLMAAFAELKRSHTSALLVIAGTGDPKYQSYLRSEAEKLNIAEEILWAGFLGPDEKAEAFAAAVVFVLPSYSENFGIAAAEALAAGVPSILCDGVALAEYAAESRAALIVPPQAKAIKDALKRVLDSAELRQQLSERGRLLCSERFSLEAVGTALKRLYLSVMPTATPALRVTPSL